MASSSAAASSSRSKKSKGRAVEAAVIEEKSPAMIENESSSEDEEESEDEDDSEEDLDDQERLVPRREQTAVEAAAAAAAQALPNYQPPAGMNPANVTSAFKASPFEWDNMLAAAESGNGVELWAVRVPQDLKTSRLSALNVTVPPKSTANPDPQARGTLVTSSGKKHYKLSEAGSSKGSVQGGEEMKGLRLMVPRIRKGGKLFTAPLAVTRHLILEASEGPVEEPAAVNSGPAPPRPKRAQPTAMLKFRNFPSGYHTTGPAQGVGMEVDARNETEEGMVNGGLHPAQVLEHADVKKDKKRKADAAGSSSKKAKKVKA